MGYRENSRPTTEFDLLGDVLIDLKHLEEDLRKMGPPTWAPTTYTVERDKQTVYFLAMERNIQFIRDTIEIIRRNH